MKYYQKKLLNRIAEEFNVSPKALQSLIASARKYTYENTTDGQRQNDYLGIIKVELNNKSK